MNWRKWRKNLGEFKGFLFDLAAILSLIIVLVEIFSHKISDLIAYWKH